MEELIDAIVQEYLVHIEPLAYLIEKVAEAGKAGMLLSAPDMEDLVEEASAAAFAIVPLHALLSSLRNTHLGNSDPPSFQFVRRVINENVLVLLRDNMARAVSRLIRDCGNGSARDIDTAVKRASQTICVELARIKDLNRGFLPHPDLKELWDRFSCQELYSPVRDVRPVIH